MPQAGSSDRTQNSDLQVLRAVAAVDDRALVVVTHDARIFNFADRIAHMDDGRITTITADHVTREAAHA